MAKSDKELTAEIVVAFLDSWNGEGKTPPDNDQLPIIIQIVYDAVHKLEPDN